MADKFANRNAALDSPASGAFAITPDDETDLATITRGIYVGTSGDLAVIMLDDTSVTLVDIVAGVVHPLRVKRVLEASTADDIVGFY
jgi:hypothetical protein